MSNSVKYPLFQVVEAAVLVDKVHGYDKTKNRYTMAEMLTGQTVVNEEVEAEDVVSLIDWGMEQKGSDFFRSLRDILSKQELQASQFGFIACLPFLKRQQEKKAEQKEELAKTTANSDWIGTEGKRGEFFVKLTNKRYLDNYGSYIYSVVTRDENLGVFFNQNNFDVVEGDCFIMKATPKRHQVSNYHGGKETMFNRVVVKEVIGRKETA